MEMIKKRRLRKFKNKIMINKKFIKTNDKQVLFISVNGDGFEQINRNISHFFYDKNMIDVRHDSVKKQVKAILKAKYIFTDGLYLPLGYLTKSDKVIVNIGASNFSLSSNLIDGEMFVKPKMQKLLEKTLSVYNYHTVGSIHLLDLYKKSYNINEDKILKIGMPKMDEYFGYSYKENAERVMQSYPDSLVNLNVLYVPKDNVDKSMQIEFVEKMVKSFDDSTSVYYYFGEQNSKKSFEIIGAHELYKNEVSSFFSIANVIISDESDLIFEGCVTNTPIVFYGENINHELEGYKTTSSDEMIEYIAGNGFANQDVSKSYECYNEFNHGKSSRDLVLKILGQFKRSNG
jgi:hypothetical protein